VDTVEKAAVATQDTTMYPHLSRCRTRWGADYASAVEWPGVALSWKARSANLLRRLRLRAITSCRRCTRARKADARQSLRVPCNQSCVRSQHESDMHISTRLLRQHIAPGREV